MGSGSWEPDLVSCSFAAPAAAILASSSWVWKHGYDRDSPRDEYEEGRQSVSTMNERGICGRREPDEEGLALLITLIALSLISLLCLYMTLSATTEMRVSDNFEGHLHAKHAALAGINHARALLRGLDYDSLLRGTDGAYEDSAGYLTQARAFAFRNPVAWSTARSLNISDPALTGIPDDGIINAAGVGLIPYSGILLTAPNPYGAGVVTIGRYYVKASDNNGEPSELAGDPSDNPFVDGDGTIIIRSMGVAQTLGEPAGSAMRRNSVVAFEARYRRRSTFDLGSPLTIVGSNVNAAFDGDSFSISGGAGPGIGTIDIDPADGLRPDEIIRLAVAGKGSITGAGLPYPSIQDITGSVKLDPERALLLDPKYLLDFVTNTVLEFADYVYSGDQNWAGGAAPYLGAFDVTKPTSDTAQDPKITVVKGSLAIGGGVSGGGILVVRGDLRSSSGFSYSGLVLIIGTGRLESSGLDPGILGGVLLATIDSNGVNPAFGVPTLFLGGNSFITANGNAIKMAIGLLPPAQISFREITDVLDPP